jgi:phage terminase small subunit
MSLNATKFDKNTGKTVSPGSTPERAKPLDFLPAAPDWITEGALDEWNRIGPELVERKVLTAESLMMFAHYCAINERLIINPQASKLISLLTNLANLLRSNDGVLLRVVTCSRLF